MPTDNPIVSACCGATTRANYTLSGGMASDCVECGEPAETLKESTRNAILLEQWERDRDAVAFLPTTGTVVDAFNALDATRPTP